MIREYVDNEVFDALQDKSDALARDIAHGDAVDDEVYDAVDEIVMALARNAGVELGVLWTDDADRQRVFTLFNPAFVEVTIASRDDDGEPKVIKFMPARDLAHDEWQYNNPFNL